jgi:adenine-specific DNA methylase
MPYRRKLIEVALSLEAISAESAREKSVRQLSQIYAEGKSS